MNLNFKFNNSYQDNNFKSPFSPSFGGGLLNTNGLGDKAFGAFNFNKNSVDTSGIDSLKNASTKSLDFASMMNPITTGVGFLSNAYSHFDQYNKALDTRNRLDDEFKLRTAERNSLYNESNNKIETARAQAENTFNQNFNKTFSPTLAGSGTKQNLLNMAIQPGQFRAQSTRDSNDLLLDTARNQFSDANKTESEKAGVMASAGNPWANTLKSAMGGGMNYLNEGNRIDAERAKQDFIFEGMRKDLIDRERSKALDEYQMNFTNYLNNKNLDFTNNMQSKNFDLQESIANYNLQNSKNASNVGTPEWLTGVTNYFKQNPNFLEQLKLGLGK